jgi:glycosyltransferase involved in cell wall biosynthesis
VKEKILFILHTSPPKHGAAKVGDFIKDSNKIKEKFNCKFISIKSSETIADIGKFNLKKIKYVFKLYFNVLFTLITFKPDKIYYTSSIRSVAFYRDILISTLWKIYSKFKHIEIFYHYHTKGVDKFVSKSKINYFLTKFFVKDVNLILLSPLLKKDFNKINSYKKIFFLPNGVEDNLKNLNFNAYVDNKYQNIKKIEVLYLAHLMKSKGYQEVLYLAKKFKQIIFHFAGGFGNEEDKKIFFNFINKYKLNNVKYHGFVSGEEKDVLFKQVLLYIYPTKNDAFPLSILESLSYGVPVISTNEGSIPYILDKNSGIIIDDLEKLEEAFNKGLENLINKNISLYCRKRYLENFTLEKFEENLIKILKEKTCIKH